LAKVDLAPQTGIRCNIGIGRWPTGTSACE
jgi:hypothetical protein